jgi:hypothetical protein
MFSETDNVKDNNITDPVIAFYDYDYEDKRDDDNKEPNIYHTTIIHNETKTMTNETMIIKILNEQNEKIETLKKLLDQSSPVFKKSENNSIRSILGVNSFEQNPKEKDK